MTGKAKKADAKRREKQRKVKRDGVQMEKYKIDKQEVKEICEGSKELDSIDTVAALKDFFSQKTTKGMWLRDIMEAVGIGAGQIPAEKDKKIQWILEHVEIQGIKASSEKFQESAEIPQEDVRTQESTSDTITPCLLSREDLNTFLGNVRRECFQVADDRLDITKARIYEGIPVEYQDNFCVQYQPGFYEGLVVILKGSENTVVAAGSLQQEKNKYHIILDRDNIDYDAFGSNKKYRLGLFKENEVQVLKKEKLQKSDAIEFAGSISTVSCTIDYKPMDISNNALCIDFGTSNTSAGSYGIINPEQNDIELVSFTDVTSPEMKESKLYPTMVYVENCQDAAHIRYLFGYEAKKKVVDKGYDMDESVFFEIKRWMGSLNQEEEIRDADGNTVMIKRREIIKAYMIHIIELSQQYFKVKFRKLHLSAPVRLKEKFYNEMSSMLEAEGYKVLPPESSVDEGIAIIYNNISTMVDQGEIRENDKKSIMILDCGGGTTDLASCEVSAKNLETGRKLKITAKFVNGNSNFGGNNITFRIMQLLKIKLAEKYAPEYMENCSLNELIPMEESQILNEVEVAYKESKGRAYNSDNKNKIYEKYMDAYQKAENVIPTRFTDNDRFEFAGQLKKIKRNYYYLWQLAEKIKIKFYEEDVVSIGFRSEENKPLEFDTIENYYLYIINGEDLEKKENPADKIEITINEIRRVLCGDIFGLLNELLPVKNFEVNTYNYYRLAGQSCKINLFMELLKEFIPGRYLRENTVINRKKIEQETKGSIRLKLDCIKGSIAYIRDKECGKIKPEMETDTPELIYDIYINKVDVETRILSREETEIGYEIFSSKATKAELLVKNSFGETERKIVVELSDNSPEKIELSKMFDEIGMKGIVSKNKLNDLKEKIGAINPKDSDESDYVRIVFAIPSKEGYGMNIYCIIKEMEKDKDIYGWWPLQYENYENESTKSFFDGRR